MTKMCMANMPKTVGASMHLLNLGFGRVRFHRAISRLYVKNFTIVNVNRNDHQFLCWDSRHCKFLLHLGINEN